MSSLGVSVVTALLPVNEMYLRRVLLPHAQKAVPSVITSFICVYQVLYVWEYVYIINVEVMYAITVENREPR